jgi:putative exporter of polyketide antibiotics
MMFGVFSLLLSGLVRRNAFAVAIPLVIIVATYVLNSLHQSSESLKSVRYFSLLYYLGKPLSGDFAWIATISVLAATCILGALAILAFDRRDIYT